MSSQPNPAVDDIALVHVATLIHPYDAYRRLRARPEAEPSFILRNLPALHLAFAKRS